MIYDFVDLQVPAYRYPPQVKTGKKIPESSCLGLQDIVG